MKLKHLISTTALLCSASLMVACSSSDSTAPTTSISGSIFASSVNGADVIIKDTSGNTVAGPVTTATDGTYSVSIPDSALTSDLVFESTGGVFDDEATGAAGIGTDAGTLSAYIEGGSLAAGDSVHVTPGTTIVSNLRALHGKTASEAGTDFFNAFAYNIDTSVQPVATTDTSSTASDASRHIGWRAAVLSQLAQDLGLTAAQQFDMFAALAQDLSDGKLDGVDASGAVDIGSTGSQLPADIQAKYIAATASFTTATTESYQVTYTPPMMNVHGKNIFTLKITDTSGPVTGLVASSGLSVMPLMYMTDRTHSTPQFSIEEPDQIARPGEYEVTLFYLMPSRMMDITMGTWDLKVMVNMETAHFYPNIMPAMGDTARVQLKGINDTIIDMNGLEVGRTYNLFKDSFTDGSGSNNDSFTIFIAPIETMMSFPALVVGETLQSGMGGTPYPVNSVDVHVNVNDAGWVTSAATDNLNGLWTLSNLQFTTGSENTIQVKLIVNGETKTTDGQPVQTDTGAANYPNDFATFKLTP